MDLCEYKKKFLEIYPDYSNDISNFFDYIKEVDGLELSSNTYIVNAIDSEKVIKSLEYNIDKGRIKKQEPARKYMVAIGQLFEYLLNDEQYKNTDFKQELANPPTREKSYKGISKNFIDNCNRLLPKETYNSLSTEEVQKIITWCNKKIDDSKKNYPSLEVSSLNYKRLVAALCLKTMIFCGVTYRVARSIKLSDLNVDNNTLQVSGCELRLPLLLSEQYQFYYNLRNALGFSQVDSFLFTRPDGSQWEEKTGDSGIPCYLKTIINKTDISGVSKYGISQLITCGLNDSLIMQLTGASRQFISGCISYLKEEKTANRIINSKLLLIDKYYEL